MIVVFLTAIAIASFLGFKLYLDHQVKLKVDSVIQSLWSFATVEYENLDVGLGGRVELSGVTVRPFETNDEIKVATVSAHIPDLEFLLDAEDALAAGEIPENMTLSISGLEIDTQGGLLQGARQALVSAEGEEVLCLSDEGKYALLADLGYEKLIMRGQLGYSYDPGTSRLKLFSNGEDAGISAYDLEVELKLPLASEMAAGSFASGRFLRAKFNYKDTGYNEKLIAYCSVKLGVSAEHFLQSKTHYNTSGRTGWVFGDGLRRAYYQFSRPDGSIFVSATPGEPVAPMSLLFYAPQDLVRELGIAVNVNGEPVEDLRIDISDGKVPKTKAPREAVQSALIKGLAEKVLGEGALEKENEANDTPKELVGRYVPASVDRISSYVGRKVRVFTVTGFTRAGKLTKVRDGEAVVMWNVGRGEMAANIPVNSIKRIELLVFQ